MNQTQRRYAITRMTEITNRKIREVQTAFNNRPENTHRGIPHEIHASSRDILLALMGEPVQGVQLLERDELIREITSIRDSYTSAIYPSRFAKPINHLEIQEAKRRVDDINNRKETQLNVAIEAIKAENLRWQDAIMLGDDEEVMSAIAAFEAFEATPVSEINV